MANYQMLFLCVWTWLSAIVIAQIPFANEGRILYGSCAIPVLEDFGSNTTFTDDGLLSWAYAGISGANILPRPLIKIIALRIICTNIGVMRNTVQDMNLIAQYECMGTSCPNDSSYNTTVYTHQFFFSCLQTNSFQDENGLLGIANDGGFLINVKPVANISTPHKYCGQCTYTTGTDQVHYCRGKFV